MKRLLSSTIGLLAVCTLMHTTGARADHGAAELSAQDAELTREAEGDANSTVSTVEPPLAPPENYAVPPPPIGPLYPGPADPGMSLDADEEGPHIPARVATRLRVLGTDLDALASRSSSGLSSGVMSILAGGLSIALAQLIDQSAVRTFLYVFGTSSLLRGGLELTLSPDAEGAALSYSHMPMRVPEEVMERLRYGERALADLASDSRRLRLLDGAVSIAAGAITVPFLLLGPDDAGDSKFDTLDLFVVVGAGVSVLSGIVSLVSRSEAEKRNDAYLYLKARLAKSPRTSAPPQLTVSAAPGFVALRMRGHFAAL